MTKKKPPTTPTLQESLSEIDWDKLFEMETDDSQIEQDLVLSRQTRLKEAARSMKATREIGADEDEARWDDRLRKVVKHKPVPEKPSE